MIFTTLLKHPFSFLRRRGHHSIIYIDDAYLQGDSYGACYNNVYETVSLFQKLGFTINLRKSVLHPAQKIDFLGFVLDSHLMTITLSQRRIDGIISACTILLQGHSYRIRHVASALGMLFASLSAVRHGALFYRAIERDKNAALRRNNGNFRTVMTLPVVAKNEILQWHNHIGSVHHFIHPPPPIMITIYSDASLEGWGATDSTCMVGGRWDEDVALEHINSLGLFAAKLALEELACSLHDCHIKLKIDNTTAVTLTKWGVTT